MSDYFADRAFAAQPVYLTDLDRCRPARALSREPKLRHWRTLEYATGAFSGVMLLAGPETAAPPVTCPLRAAGWHAISVGVLPIRSTEEGRQLELQLRLSGERVPTMLTVPPGAVPGGAGPGLVELFWKLADLTNRDLEISQVATRVASGDAAGSFDCGPVRLAYVKLVPISDAERAAVQSDRRRTDTRRLFAHQDANGPQGLWRLSSAEEIQREIEPYRDTDFSRMYWEVGRGDLMFAFTEIGREATFYGLNDFARRFDRLHVESRRCFRKLGADPFRIALDYTHDVGMEFHAAYRVAGFRFPPPPDHFNYGDSLYDAHPEWRGVGRNGDRTPRLAYTYPQVRGYVVSLLREMARAPIDGVCLLYCRRPPLVEYEPPLVAGFQREYGRDPFRIDPHDPDWLSYRSCVLTQFMREVRAALDEVAQAQGRPNRIQLSAVVMGTERENLYYGMDLRAWLREGLVDTLIPYTSAPELDGVTPAWADPASLRFFVDLVRGTDVILAPNVMPRHMSPGDLRRRAAAIYDAGAEHMFFWDCAAGGGRANYRAMWSALRRLGRRDEIEAWRRAGEPDLSAPTVPLQRLGDWDLSYATPG